MTTTVEERGIGGLHEDRSAVHFGRVEFLEIVRAEAPRIIYRGTNGHFFFISGLAVCTSECDDSDFIRGQVVLPWLHDVSQ